MHEILVVEDNLSLQNLIVKKLEQNNFSVAVAQSMEKALEILALKKIEVVWLDHYLLGNKNGFDLVVEMKKDGSGYKKVPIFVVANSADNEKTNAYLRMGVEKYYLKSGVSLNNIAAEINDFLEK